MNLSRVPKKKTIVEITRIFVHYRRSSSGNWDNTFNV